ncbi:MAG TPA: 4-hydroxythreonine-4-phosphate dehydrogenase PdxA [Steroidobacteraceae bacterium]|nr:4-hydroxythreonine-4-phosphate dehydrogenase PdxA [Steroidobacteraceae bacterium]
MAPQARIAVTSGEPAGVGPDLCLQLARGPLPCELVCLGDRELLAARARQLSLKLNLWDYEPGPEPRPHTPGTLAVLHVPLAVPAEAGKLDSRNAAAVLAMLDRAAQGCLSGEFAAMVTAPVQKSTIIEGGFAFTGHTEYLAQRSGAALPVMMLASGSMRVALATTHLPLANVAQAITGALLQQVLAIVAADLQRWWGIGNPRIAVCGLNPHAGESGHLGSEELTIIAPAVNQMRARGLDVSGPFAADTIFVPRLMASYDAVLAMYHDQGLPVIKHAHFDQAVNVTLGLPIIRTSVDHGTALDLAGSGHADVASLAAAVRMATTMAAHAA